jgi:hypothetical protein
MNKKEDKSNPSAEVIHALRVLAFSIVSAVVKVLDTTTTIIIQND